MTVYTWAENLFYVAFMSQIFLISYYVPKQILNRVNHVLKRYPAKDYPKLYPKPAESYAIGKWVFKTANQIILILGFVIMTAMLLWVDHRSFAVDGYISEAWPVVYGMIQFLPLIALEFSEFSQLKLMKKLNTATTRKAQLLRRGLFDFVSPIIVVSAALILCASMLFDLYANSLASQSESDAMQRILVLIITSAFFVAVGAWSLYGGKQNPHQASEDRTRQQSATLKSLCYGSMAMSIFFITQTADDLFELDYMDALLISLYLQAVTLLTIGNMLKSLKLDDMNFEVYKQSTNDRNVDSGAVAGI